MIEGRFQNTRGQNIYTVRWMPEADPKAIVLLVHGVAEHSGRYQHIADALTQQGYALFALDHFGHGKSDGVRAYVENFNDLVTDLEQYFDQIRQEYPDKKIFVYGHSMGALVGLIFTLKHQADLAGFLSSGTPLMLDTAAPKIIVSLANAISRVVPRLPLIPLNPKQLSHDPALIQAHANDSLIYHRPARVGTVVNIIKSAIQAREKVHTLQLPLFIFHGTADSITPPSGSEFLFKQAGSSDKTLKLYDGMYHETHNELDKATVINDILTWLNAHN
ncbi:MAG: alpha/beta hydrolase [Chloroflexi bacterium]|nr:MAG: alpha/beta hydrolase [Chloroflexota bacterium]